MQNSCVVRSLPRAALLGLALTTTGLAGDLNPPPGDIAPTMKSLDRIEPRRCINDLPAAADAVHVISEGGHYFLAADITGKFNAHGILVTTTEDVTIDLNGFSLNGVPGSLDGIRIDGGGGGGGGAGGMRAGISTSRSNLRRGSSKISSWGGDGVDASNCDTLECASLDITGCGGHAIVCLETKHVIHRDIAARNCLLDGLRIADLGSGAFGKVYRAFESCSIDSCGGNGITVETDLDNADISVRDTSTSDCNGHGLCTRHVTPGGAGGGSGGSIRLESITSTSNGGDGVHLLVRAGGHMCASGRHMKCSSNTGDGFAMITDNAAIPHDGPLATIEHSDFSNNGGNGLRSENPIYIGSSHTGNNALYGGRFAAPDATVLAASMESCTSKGNGSGGMRCSKGRYANADCQISDEGGNGITLDEGCLVMTRSSVHHCTGDGVAVTGTINMQDSTFRRNSGTGVRGTTGSMVASRCAMELNDGGGATFTDCTTVTLEACVFNDNTGNGVTCSSSTGVPVRWMAPECIASRNSGNGFDLNNCDGGQLSGARTSGNNGRGVFCRPGFINGAIERCTSAGDQGGIHVAGTGNLIRACSAKNGPLGAFMFAQGNAAGPIIDSASLASSCSPHANVQH